MVETKPPTFLHIPISQPQLKSVLTSTMTFSKMSSEQYEVMYTLRSELFNKHEDSIRPGPFEGPRGFGRSWMKMDLTPAERDVFLKYRQKGKQTAAAGGLLGATTMAGIWKLAALRRGVGITGVIVGGVIGAGISMRGSGIQREMVTEMLRLPAEKSQRAAQAREILQTKLQHNAFAQELLKDSGFPLNQDPIDQE